MGELDWLARWVVSETLKTDKRWSKPCRRGRGGEQSYIYIQNDRRPAREEEVEGCKVLTGGS